MELAYGKFCGRLANRGCAYPPVLIYEGLLLLLLLLLLLALLLLFLRILLWSFGLYFWLLTCKAPSCAMSIPVGKPL